MTRYYPSKNCLIRFISVSLYHKNIFSLLFFASVLFLAFSCEEDPTGIGKSILPESDFVSVNSIDTLSVMSYTMYDKLIRTDNASVSFLGQMVDPYFGTTDAEFVSQLRLGRPWDGSVSYTVDSVKLYLRLLTVKKNGSSDMVHTLKLSETDKHIYTDSAYYSTTSVPLTGFEVSAELPALKADTINDIEVTIPVEFGNYIIRDTSMLFYSNTKPDFRSYFKGLLFQLSGDNDPMMVSLSLVSSNTVGGYYNNYFDLYMHDTEGNKAQYLLILDPVNKNASFSRFMHDLSTADPDKQIKHINDNHKDTLSYLQSLNGVFTKISIPGLTELRKNASFLDKLAINKARLIIPVQLDGDLYTTSTIPQQLYLRYRTASGFKYVVPDYSVDSYHNFFDGKLDTLRNVYNFNIPTLVQNYLKDKTDTILPDLEIFQALDIKNVILKANNSKTPVKFELTYTKF